MKIPINRGCNKMEVSIYQDYSKMNHLMHQKDHEHTDTAAIETLIEEVCATPEHQDPAEHRRDNVLRSFKYLSRIRYGSLDAICQVLAYKYYYRPRSVYAIICRNLDKLKAGDFGETKISVNELLEIAEHLKLPYWMDNQRRHNDVRATFYQWQNLGDLNFLCRLLGHQFYYRPNTVRQILKEG